MTSRDFAFWLQGYFEILDPKMEAAPFPLGPAQVKAIRDHLQLVFTHDINPPPKPPKPIGQIDWQKVMRDGPEQFVTGVWDPNTATFC